jgi:DnaJ domain
MGMSPWDVLGLEPNATPEQVKAVYRQLAMQFHPDRNPGDAAAEERMKEINDAYAAITRGCEWGGIYGFVVWLVAAIAGSGKTKAFAASLAATRVTHTVVACPTIALIGEIEAWLLQFEATVPVAVIHSEQSDRQVQERIGKWFERARKKPDPRGGVLVCSHAATLDMTTPPVNAGAFDLVFDELPDIYQFAARQFGPFGHQHITRHLTATPYRKGVLRLQPADIGGKHYERLRSIARNAPRRCEVDALFQDWSAAVLDPHRWVLVLEDQWLDLVLPYSSGVFGGELDVLTVLHPDRFRAWKSVTMMGARSDQTMAHLLWSRLFGQRFANHPLQRGLPTHHVNGHLLTLKYFWQNRATRSMLAKKAEGGGTMQTAMCRSVAEHYGTRQFLWSLPQPRDHGGVKDRCWQGGGSAFDPDLRLPGRSFGLNKWRDYHNLALMSVVNPSPDQYRLLELLGLPEEDVFEALSCTILYQDLLRSSLRVPTAKAPVECVIPCLPSAAGLERVLTGCAVHQMPVHLVPRLAEPGRRGPKPTGTAMDPAERQRKSRAARRAQMEQEKQRQREAAN